MKKSYQQVNLLITNIFLGFSSARNRVGEKPFLQLPMKAVLARFIVQQRIVSL